MIAHLLTKRQKRFLKFSISRSLLLPLFLLAFVGQSTAQDHSVAREWNEVLLEGIRNDYARPTVHARNLFHISMAMYDAWAAFDDVAEPFFLGHTLRDYTCEFDGIALPDDGSIDVKTAREEAISYAAYRLIRHRFATSPGRTYIAGLADNLMQQLGYSINFTSTDYSDGNPAALGNYLAEKIIDFGLNDNSFEQFNYSNRFYSPINPPLVTKYDGNPDIIDPNRWQPLTLDLVIDQSGNVIPVNTPPFLSPEWGQVVPFALSEEDLTVYNRDGFDYWIYHDPGSPPQIHPDEDNGVTDYHWTFSTVAIWSSHLDHEDGVLWDISPAGFGNLDAADIPRNFSDYPDFYDQLNGGTFLGHGRAVNPYTGQPYEPQIVPRGDYTRVLAEFWADGPDSETPPGHWFTILNYVTDHPAFEARFEGQGEVMDPLEWDVKTYFTLGGAMHDAAVTAWGIKGYYDYLRPISAIRYMSDHGQCSDKGRDNFNPAGLPLVPGYIEVVEEGDPLAGSDDANVGKIKVKAWRGPDYVPNPKTDYAGVGWILAEDWWPYQRPTFVTPPFAGYVSGHSTFSRAAAEVMTDLTGDEYFPGGMGEFYAKKNEFLVFEEGPSVDVTLQWATYRDASDQTSLSRIWGGIHPPADDLPGRLIGLEIAEDAITLAKTYFNGGPTGVFDQQPKREQLAAKVYPNPARTGEHISVEIDQPDAEVTFEVMDMMGRRLITQTVPAAQLQMGLQLNPNGKLPAGTYLLRVSGKGWEASRQILLAGE
ncbi:MAG: T9SS type A sorting domain-containing protein [Saprospiraceae bacterium]|nr:T9SS type A sorting domain-containing protein [Lewinella sp.]